MKEKQIYYLQRAKKLTLKPHWLAYRRGGTRRDRLCSQGNFTRISFSRKLLDVSQCHTTSAATKVTNNLRFLSATPDPSSLNRLEKGVNKLQTDKKLLKYCLYVVNASCCILMRNRK